MISGLLIGTLGFQFVFEQINRREIKLINHVHEKTRNLKHKKLIQFFLMIFISVVIWGIMNVKLVGEFTEGIIIGFVWALIMFIFEDTIFDNMRNSLR